ncbi:tubulin glycylase 3A-like [Danaus plexippus]|nr:tubulin glycylase 3A-like [Danaus plexippus]XP_032510700.2 tubulin glycylase 3A-like [Danaus plexippus]
MPIRKKRLAKRKKKVTATHSFPRKNSKPMDGIRKSLGGAFDFKNNSIEKSRVRRIFCPLNKFARNIAGQSNKNKLSMAYKSNNKHIGLTRKEKTFVICSCQNKSTKYVKLKDLAASAVKENKIFAVYGNCNAVRKALTERGWIEKIPPNRMNLLKIRNGTYSSKTEIQNELERLLLSNLIEKCNPNFVWRTRDQRRDTTIDMNKDCHTIINKLEIDALWTSKQGLCSSLKRNYWFYIEDIAEVNAPRSYNTSDFGELESFEKDFKITACTSLLKWILSMVANDRPIFQSTGKISLNIIVFALNRCKEYLFQKQNKDIDTEIPEVRESQWSSFLKKYYCIISKDEVFQEDTRNKIPLYLSYAKFLLKEVYRYRPQLSCEGCHNIWIIKPAYCSRGRGIRMASKLGVITSILTKANSKFVIQKYIEEPLLIYETKFDIRQYYLVTSTYPLVIWMYTDCYLKFSSQRYNLKNYHESIHLTNNAVQKKYTNCIGRHTELPNQNMWDSDKYKHYLNKIGKEKVWDTVIYPGMKKSIIGIMLGCQDTLSVSKNRFELYGCDFLLDKEYRPWLIEINSCPDLNHTTPVTAKICPAVISDIIKVVIDFAKNPKAATGKFECIYRQPMTLPRYGSAAELFVRGYSLSNEYFYKGKIEIQESYADPTIGKESNIKAVLQKLKQLHEMDDDIMKQPEDDLAFPERKDRDTCTHKTLSEYELSMTAAVITEQLNELMDRVTSDSSFNSKKSDCEETPCPKQNICSVTNISTLLRKSVCNFLSGETIEKAFRFSKLDDGPRGKGSIVELNDIEKIFYNLTLNNNVAKCSPSKNIQKNYSQDVLKATTKLVSFINRKEKEYRKYI